MQCYWGMSEGPLYMTVYYSCVIMQYGPSNQYSKKLQRKVPSSQNVMSFDLFFSHRLRGSKEKVE